MVTGLMKAHDYGKTMVRSSLEFLLGPEADPICAHKMHRCNEGRWHIKPLWIDNMVRELATNCHGMTLIPGINVVELGKVV